MDTRTQHLQRAESLMEVNRLDMALQEIQKALATYPEDPEALYLECLCYTRMNKHHKAIEIARKLLTSFPEYPLVYYYLAINLFAIEAVEEAEDIAHEGLRIAPNFVELFGLLGRIYLHKRDWEKALEYADEGLALSATDEDCLNVRIYALTKLNRREELHVSMQDSLEQNPNNAHSHANVGWAKLQTGDYQTAKEHFVEALRINPNYDDARVGLLETLKAKNAFYRIFLNWMFWMSKKTSEHQWVVIIGLYIGFRLLRNLSAKFPILVPVVLIVAFLFYLTWIMSPLFDLFIKLDKTARYALTKEESNAANAVGLGLMVGLSSFLVGFLMDIGFLYMVGLVALTIVIPASMYYDFKNTTHEFHGKLSFLALFMTGFGALVFLFLNEYANYPNPFGAGMLGTYAIGIFGYQFAANYWQMKARPIE